MRDVTGVVYQTLDYDEDYEPMHFDMYGWALHPVQEVAAEPVAQQPKDGIQPASHASYSTAAYIG